MAPLSIINSIFEKQIISLIWQSGLLLIVLISFYVAKLKEMLFIDFIAFFTLVLSIYYILMIPILYLVAKGKL